MDLNFSEFKKFIEECAKPRWEKPHEKWPLRPGGGELYLQEKILGKADKILSKDSILENARATLIQTMNAHVNLMSQFEFSFAKYFITETEEEILSEKTLSLLYGKESLEKRLYEFLEWAKVKPVPNTKKKTGINATVCSYFLALSNPKKYPYCKPIAYKTAVDTLLTKQDMITDPVKRIVHCKDLYLDVLKFLETEYGLENGNLLDVHSLFYLLNAFKEPKLQYWVYAPGHGAELWDELYDQGIIAIGWDKIGDLRAYDSKESIKEKLKEAYSYDTNPTNRALACYEFANEVNEGDIVFVKKGTKELLGYGVVISDYIYDNSRKEYKNVRKVDWKRSGSWDFSDDKFALKTLTNITPYSDFVEKLLKIVESKPHTKNYWWLNANPKIWDFYKFDVGDKQIYTSKNEKGNKRRIYKRFTEVQPGDNILLYVSTPVREVAGLCEATTSLHETEEGEGFEFVKTEQFSETLSLEEIISVPALQDSEPLKNNNQGSLFKLTEDEFETIKAIIDAKGPIVEKVAEPYSVNDALKTVFLSKDNFTGIIDLLKHKKNIILQGPPGVGKTFIAKHIAWAMMGKKDNGRIQMIQFHQSYAYEDFIQGYRPDESGNFYLKNGVFYKFCRKADRDSEKNYFFIIDEINRGNLSKIFGELMMLIESDKRGEEILLTYSKSDDETFTVPPNVHLIATMNTADRSLAMVDYALRRRFCFVDLMPAYETNAFNSFLKNADIEDGLIKRINKNLSAINSVIKDDTKNLGPGFRIGHSYFCSARNGDESGESWYERIIEFEIAPLIREYWFDRLEKAEKYIELLKE